jgi:hypothetical protein
MSRGLVNNMLTMNNLGDGSTLSLDFTTMGGVLDPRLTFSRASTATFVNSSGYVEYAGANLLLQSETISTSPWSDQNGATRLQVSITNPIGGATSTQVTSGTASNAISQLPTYQAGLPHIIRIWVRAGTSSQLQLGVFAGAFVTGTISVISGTATVSNTGLFLVTGLTSTWTQLQIVYPSLTGSGAFLIYPDTASPVAGRTIYVWGAQLNPGSTAQTYYPTTTAAYHAPRFDYSPTNIGEPRGLLIEGQTANVCPQSQALTTGWIGANMNTPTNPAIPDPFGGTSATWKLVAPISTSALRGWRHAVVTLTAANYTFSFWAKAAEFDRIVLGDPGSGRGGCKFVLVGNGTATVIAGSTTPTNPKIELFPGGWYRCSVTMLMLASTYAMGIAGYPSATTPNEYGATYAQTNLDGVYATGLQIELGSGASSYIPTGASQVTRNADQVVLSDLTGISFNQLAGTMYSQVELVEKLRGSFIPYGSFDTTGGGRGWWWLRHNHDTSVGQRILGSAFNSVGGSAINSSNYTHSNGVLKFATSLDPTAGRMVYAISGGSAQITTATGFTLATAAQMSINKNNDVLVTETGSMWFRTLKYWPTALPDAQLTSITS